MQSLRHKYKDIIFQNDSTMYEGCLNEIRKQQVYDDKVHNQKLMENTMRKLAWDSLQKTTVMDGNIMTDKRTCKVLGPEVDYNCNKEKF